MSKLHIEQRIVIKFCFRNEIPAAQTFRMLQRVYGDQTMSRTHVYKWYKDFKEGRERITDFERLGRPSTSTDEHNVKKIKELVLENRQLSIRALANMVGISFGSVDRILKNHLGLQKLKTGWC